MRSSRVKQENEKMTQVGTHSEYLDNIGEAADPGATNDSTQGYSLGSKWYNTSTGIWWRCTSATAGAATWVSNVQAGANNTGTVAGGATNVLGGSAVTAAGGAAVLKGGLSTKGNGGNVSIFGGQGTVNGSIILGAGSVAGALPTADPHVLGALFGPSVAGAVSISAG